MCLSGVAAVYVPVEVAIAHRLQLLRKTRHYPAVEAADGVGAPAREPAKLGVAARQLVYHVLRCVEVVEERVLPGVYAPVFVAVAVHADAVPGVVCARYHVAVFLAVARDEEGRLHAVFVQHVQKLRCVWPRPVVKGEVYGLFLRRHDLRTRLPADSDVPLRADAVALRVRDAVIHGVVARHVRPQRVADGHIGAQVVPVFVVCGAAGIGIARPRAYRHALIPVKPYLRPGEGVVRPPLRLCAVTGGVGHGVYDTVPAGGHLHRAGQVAVVRVARGVPLLDVALQPARPVVRVGHKRYLRRRRIHDVHHALRRVVAGFIVRLVYQAVAAYPARVHIALTGHLQRQRAAERAHGGGARPRIAEAMSVFHVHFRLAAHVKAHVAVVHHEKHPCGKKKNEHCRGYQGGVRRRAGFQPFQKRSHLSLRLLRYIYIDAVSIGFVSANMQKRAPRCGSLFASAFMSAPISRLFQLFLRQYAA